MKEEITCQMSLQSPFEVEVENYFEQAMLVDLKVE